MNSRPEASALRAVGAATVGNVLEWFDFIVYGYFAAIIAPQFFPANKETTSLLAAFAAFGVGFIFRPLGAVVIGLISDKKGRKPALVLTMMLMASGMLMIGLVPSYDAIGVAAPIILLLARLLQGFSIGGEWGASVVYLVESAPEGKRGLYGSLQQATVIAGLLLGSGIAAALATLLDPVTLQSWGWRVPFLVGAVLIAPVGFYMRRNIDETKAHLQRAERTDAAGTSVPIAKTVHAFGISVIWSVAAYIFLVYMPTFTEKYAGLSHAAALWSNTSGLLLLMIAIPVCGLASDHIGRKPLLLAACLAFIALPFPLFRLVLEQASIGLTVMAQLLVGLAAALYFGPGPAAIAELFDGRTRTTGLSIGNGAAVPIFGGFAPFVATWLIGETGSPIAPIYYVIAAAAVSALVILGLRETAHRKLG